MNAIVEVTFCGRRFTAQEVELMRVVARDYAGLGVTEIARTICELLEWTRPNGELKNHECRQLLERLAAEGMLTLPALRNLGGRGLRRVNLSQQHSAPEPVECAARECEPLELVLVAGEGESRRWREHVERYHYLGCRVPFGAHLRYWVRNRDRELACLLWTSPAWKMRARDAWIGWNDEQRKRNLQWTVNNGRFLILPCCAKGSYHGNMDLTGKKIAILVDQMYQEMEVWYPLFRFQEAGATVVTVGAKAGETYGSKLGYPVKCQLAYDDANPADFDGVVVPGGYAPDHIRRHPKANQFVQHMDAAGKLVASICHGPWVLCSAGGMLKGRKATSFFAIKDDVVNAGAEWVDAEVVVDRNLVTSRKPEDLPAFCRAAIQVLAGPAR